MKRIIDVNKLLERVKELQEAECSLSAYELIPISEPYGFRPLTKDCKPKEGDEVIIKYENLYGVTSTFRIESWANIDLHYCLTETRVNVRWMPIPGGE